MNGLQSRRSPVKGKDTRTVPAPPAAGHLPSRPGPAVMEVVPSASPALRQADDDAPLLSLPTEKKKLEDLVDLISHYKTENEQIRKPKAMKTKLKPHQMEALKWMLAKESLPEDMPSGGILADDMGLGKTASMIALHLKSKEKAGAAQSQDGQSQDSSQSSDEESEADDERSPSGKPKGGTLVICPPTLMDHWEQDIIRHVRSQELPVTKHHGSQRTTDPDKLARLSGFVICSYGVLRLNVDKDAVFGVSWERVILDEAHEVRNPESVGCRAVTKLEARHRWCVTGTPMHNGVVDLHGLFKFMHWGPYCKRESWEFFFGASDMSNQPLWWLLRTASMMRRLKSDYEEGNSVALPPKSVETVRVVFDLNEREAYDKLSQSIQRHLADIASSQDSKRAKYKYMHSVLLLRQSCCHPVLIKEEGNVNEDLDMDEPIQVGEEEEGPNRSKEFLEIQAEWNGTKKSIQGFCSFDHPIYQPDRPSSKMEKMLEIVQKATAGGDKIVVVSQWTRVLELISSYLDKKNISHGKIEGKVAYEGRSQVVKDFNDPSNALKVLLLSLKAGGVGLNLIGGNHMILFDPHWNPQLERQACDRIHRMGQTKPVFIHKLIVEDSIEEVIENKQNAKLDLAKTVLDNPSPRNFRQVNHLGNDPNAISEILQYEARRSCKRKAEN